MERRQPTATGREEILVTVINVIEFRNGSGLQYRAHRAILRAFRLAAEYVEVCCILTPTGVDETGDRTEKRALEYRAKGV